MRIWCIRCTSCGSAPPVIELRPQPEAPRRYLAPKLAAFVRRESTGTRWTIAVSAAAGEATPKNGDPNGYRAEDCRRGSPVGVRTILLAFPGARIDTVRDKTVDAVWIAGLQSPIYPALAPPEAAYFDEEPMEIDL